MALSAYTKALEIKPDYFSVYNNMGNALKVQGEKHKAIEAYKKAININPNYVEAKTNLAILLYDGRQYEEAAHLFSLNDTALNQSYLLKCLYNLDEKAKFFNQLDLLTAKGVSNAVIGSFIYQSEIRYGIKKPNPFCNNPFKYILKKDLTKECDFKNIFVQGAEDILTNEIIQRKVQGHLTNGVQTAGNVFTQMGPESVQIQNIIYSELEKYRDHFKESEEGIIKNWPTDYSIFGWLVSMKSGGELKPHIHDDGWVTGSIYINVPPKVEIDSGNLVLSLTDEKSRQNEVSDVRSIDVVTGSLCLFPSSLLHYTIPFQADEDRIVLAFDMIPNA